MLHYVFYRDYLPLHQSWSDLVLCALRTKMNFLKKILLTLWIILYKRAKFQLNWTIYGKVIDL